MPQPANITSANNEIYGVIPYVAPEIFRGSEFSKESDIYSMGMIMWEFTAGCQPFSNVAHDIHLVYKILNGKRPEITEDTPEYFANLMKSCWDSDPKKRPSITKISNLLYDWSYNRKRSIEKTQFSEANIKRAELIKSKKLIPQELHPKAVYTSRPLSSLIYKCSSINSLSNGMCQKS